MALDRERFLVGLALADDPDLALAVFAGAQIDVFKIHRDNLASPQ
jgi:hypothetical protein